MKKLIILLFSALSLTAFAQQKKVAVYVTGEQNAIGKVLGDQLVAAFAKSGKYIAIERTASFLSELRKEQDYQTKGFVDENELSRLGKQFGVQFVCVADISDVFEEKYVSARLIDVESAEVINTSNADSPLSSMQELLTVTDKLAKELTDKTVQEKAAETLAQQQEKERKEKELQQMIDNGYIKAGNIYATISYTSRVSWDAIESIASECHIGNMTGWRLPSVSEFDLVISMIIRYRDEFQNLQGLMDPPYGNCNPTYFFWTSNKTYGAWQCSRYMCNECSQDALLMLVHDAK